MSAECDCFGRGSVVVFWRISLLGGTDLVIRNEALNAIWYRDETFHAVVRLFTNAVGPGFVLMDNKTPTFTMLQMSLST